MAGEKLEEIVIHSPRTSYEKENKMDDEEKKNAIIKAQLKALDDVVAVNSLFTIAIFVGLSLASPNQRSLEGRTECDADPGTAQRLVLYEVVSFALFLLSSLSAKTCKVILNTRLNVEGVEVFSHGRGFKLVVSASASVAGVVFLTLSMVNVVEIKIGKLSCGSTYAIRSVACLCAIVVVALLIYGIHMIVAVSYYILLEKFLEYRKQLWDQLSEFQGKVSKTFGDSGGKNDEENQNEGEKEGPEGTKQERGKDEGEGGR